MPGTLFMVRMRNRCNGHVSCFGSGKPRCAVLTAEPTAVEQGIIGKTHTGVVDVARAMARALIRTSCLTSCQEEDEEEDRGRSRSKEAWHRV
jgi:hypothetical protein